MKRCPHCRQMQGEFRRNRKSVDGLHSWCIECERARGRLWREQHLEQVRAKARRKNARPLPRAPTRDVPRLARAAHMYIKKEVRDGRLVRPVECPRCGSRDYKVHAHHEDYNKPAEVTWLCAKCHRRHHAALPSPEPPKDLGNPW